MSDAAQPENDEPSSYKKIFVYPLTFHLNLGMFSKQRVASRLCLFFPPDK